MTDEQLMLAVKNNHLDKAAILYERYKKMLYGFFMYKNGNDKAKSEDHVQQVFYRLIKYRLTYKQDSNFKVWLYTIAWNVQHQDYKQSAKLNLVPMEILPDEAHVQTDDRYEALHKAINLLPEQQREILIMSKLLELKYEEIAQISNCTVGVVKTRVFRALQQLRTVYFKIS